MKHSELTALILNSPTDKDGKELALRHLKIFTDSAEAALNLPIIGEENVHFFKKPDLNLGEKTKLSRSDDKPIALRPGTPVRVLGESGAFIKVSILDIKKDLAEGEDSVGYILKSNLITLSLPENLLGVLSELDF